MTQIIENYPRLNVFHLHHAGALRNGMVTRWDWAGQVMTIQAHGSYAEIAIGSRCVMAPIIWTPTQGSFWPRWGCPACRRQKIWHLYFRDGTLGCRQCLKLSYASTHIWSPELWRARRLRRQLDASLEPLSPLPPRAGRRGRAATRHARITAEIQRLESAVLGKRPSAWPRLTGAADERQRRRSDRS
jgi:hypothetical protein